MHRVGSEEVSYISSMISNNSAVFEENNLPKSWNTISIISELEKIEVWSYKIGANLLTPTRIGKNKVTPKRRSMIWIITIFLWLFTVKTLVCQALIDEQQHDLLLIFGDLAAFYGEYVNRVYINSYLICWGLHAAIMYTLIGRHTGEKREWLLKFDDCWKKSNFRAKSSEDNQIEVVRKRIICIKIMKSSVVIFLVFAISLVIYGAYNTFVTVNTSLYIYLFWAIIFVIWTFISSVINLTSVVHHYIMCRAIIIRFSETKSDLEFAIKGEPPSEPWVISRLLTKHYEVCDMVIEANRFLKNYLFVFYIIFLPHLCFLIYRLFFSPSSIAVKAVAALYVCFDALLIISVSLSSAKITSMAHKPYHIVHGVGKISLPEDVQVQATLFLQRLSGSAIGLTILDTFVITGGVISSISTAIITYFSIIVEMK